MNKIINRLMFSCKKATELIEKQSDERLSFFEKTQLKLHILFCKTCNIYKKQSKAIDKALFSWTKNKTPNENIHLSDEVKSKILKKIKKM